MNPDWQTADIKAPVSYINPLPSYSRASGFPVTWSGCDIGLAGISTYDIQARVGNSTWMMWQSGTSATSAVYHGSAGHTIYFRSRARDSAGNTTAWSTAPDGETSTTLYTWQITGTVRDTRGYVTPRASVVISPAPVTAVTADALGFYNSYLKANGAHQLNVTGTGYGTSTARLDQISADKTIGPLVLPPTDDVIGNGNFEATGWGVWQGTDPEIELPLYPG